jgi:hypothetical protein
MRRVYLCVILAAMAAIVYSRIRFIRGAYDGTRDSRPVPAAVETSSYGPDSISDSAVDTGREKLEPERKPPETDPKKKPAPRPSADD